MNRYFGGAILLVSVLAGCNSGPSGRVIGVAGPIASEVAVSVPLSDLRTHPGAAAFVRVFDETDATSPIPHQVDDLDMDGTGDVLFVLVGPSEQRLRLLVMPSSTPPEFVSRAQAILAVRQGGHFEDTLYVGGSDWMPVEAIDVPEEQEQDSDWAMYEGPVWESDLIGWRYYLDDRNRTDIFAKKIPDLVLAHHYPDYHNISEWGADVLHVGQSMGIGTPGMETPMGPAVIDNAVSKRVEIVANGPLRAIIRTIYKGWMVGDASFDATWEIENRAGQRWTEHRLQIKGDSTDVVLLTGIVKHPGAPDLMSGTESGIKYYYTFGDQTDQGDGLGLAILAPEDFGAEPGAADSLSHLIRLHPVHDQVVYRALASWEMEPGAATDAAAFEVMVAEAAASWAEERTLTTDIE